MATKRHQDANVPVHSVGGLGREESRNDYQLRSLGEGLGDRRRRVPHPKYPKWRGLDRGVSPSPPALAEKKKIHSTKTKRQKRTEGGVQNEIKGGAAKHPWGNRRPKKLNMLREAGKKYQTGS